MIDQSVLILNIKSYLIYLWFWIKYKTELDKLYIPNNFFFLNVFLINDFVFDNNAIPRLIMVA